MERERRHVVLPIGDMVTLMEAAIAQGGAYDLVVTGTSMSPTLQPGRDLVRLVSTGRRAVHRGDIVFARRQNGDYVLHRVLRLHESGGCTVNGDGQVWTEEIYPGDVLAVAEALRRKGKWISADDGRYCLYVRLWRLTRPFRALLVRIKKGFTRAGRNRT